MKKSFDIVFDNVLENNSQKELEEVFKKLDIKTVYVLKEINSKEDLKEDFLIFKSNKINFKKAYFLKNPSLYQYYKEKELVFVESGSLKNNFYISNNKKIKFLTNPLSEKLSFDEQNANSCYENKIKVVFNMNLLRDTSFKNNYLKQFNIIVNFLKIHKVDMVFATFSKNLDDLISNNVLKSLLLNFNLDENILNRFLSEDILYN
jgi:hypothetical protein